MGVAASFATIPEMFQNITARFQDDPRPVMLHKVEGKYVPVHYRALKRSVELFAAGLASLGVQRGDRISIISENRPEWAISDFAIASLGAVDVPIYPTNTAKQIEYILQDAGVRFVIVSNQFQLNKVLKCIDAVPGLEKIILMSEKGPITERDTIGFSQITIMGERFGKAHPSYVSNAIAATKPDDLLTLIYTSGTTGNPKGVMLSHGNLTSNINAATQLLHIEIGDRFLSFLPLSHSFERMAGYYCAFACGCTIAYAESVETVRDNMLEVQPTIIGTVPRLFERIHSRIIKQIDNSPPVRRKIFHEAMKVGYAYANAVRRNDVSMALKMKRMVADALVFRKIRARTGGKMKFFVSGGAALPREFGEFFEAVGLRIVEGYGLTETSPVISVNLFGKFKWGSVGKVIPGVEVRIAADGEILSRGPNTMKGYWNSPESTKEVIDADGWFHTGDIGMMDSEGYLYITDRKKHLFVSSGGKNIAPQPIENLFLTSKYIEQFVLIGDRRMFLTALIVPDFDSLREYAKSNKLTFQNNAELTRLKEVHDLLDKEIAALQKDLANYERVRKFTILERPFTIEEGEITPSLKVRRKIVEEKYAPLIEKMYHGIN